MVSENKASIVAKDAAKPASKKVSKQTTEVLEKILDRISEGEPLRVICRDEDMPSWRSFYEWMEKDEDLAARFARARIEGFDAIAEEALKIADTPMLGVVKREKPDGVEVTHEDMLGHRKLQVDTRLKLLAKWDPKRYGDKIALGGAEDLPPINTQGDADLDARIAALMAANAKPES